MASGKAGLERFMEQPFIAREPGSGIRKAVDRWALEHGYDVQPAMELGSLEAMKQAVVNGLGVSVLPEAGVRAESAEGRLRVGRLPGRRSRPGWTSPSWRDAVRPDRWSRSFEAPWDHGPAR